MNMTIRQHQKRLEGLSIQELRLEYEELSGDPITSRNRRYIIKRILWRIQANEYGGLSEEALARARELADTSYIRLTPPKTKPVSEDARTVTRTLPKAVAANQCDLMPGTQLERLYKGRRIIVSIVENGFRWNGELFKSLSAVANAVTGGHWNGKLFFGLTERKGTE
jgi:hypothetical protein